jgi:hypothetical protein
MRHHSSPRFGSHVAEVQPEGMHGLEWDSPRPTVRERLPSFLYLGWVTIVDEDAASQEVELAIVLGNDEGVNASGEKN